MAERTSGLQRELEGWRRRTDEGRGDLEPSLQLRLGEVRQRRAEHQRGSGTHRGGDRSIMSRDAQRTVRGRRSLSRPGVVDVDRLRKAQPCHQQDKQRGGKHSQPGTPDWKIEAHEKRLAIVYPKIDGRREARKAEKSFRVFRHGLVREALSRPRRRRRPRLRGGSGAKWLPPAAD